MKLRNKENRLTGKLTYIDFNIDESEREIDLTILLDNSDGECIDRQFYSLDEFKKFIRDWEEIKEPLIKDKKIRNAVRAWAKAVGICGCKYDDFWKAFRYEEYTIGFSYKFTPKFGELTDGMNYTIAELCGEEEECES